MSRKKNQARKNQNVSARRLEANRQNALKSTGPRTPEGKAKSAQNAITHQLSNPLSPAHFLHSEDEARFTRLFAEYVATYRPQHRDEYDLLTEAVYAKWRQQRLWLAETAQIETAMARHEDELHKALPRADHAAHLAHGIAHSADLLRLYQRYDAQLHRQYLRCLKELHDLQASRQSPPDPPNEPLPGEDQPPPQSDRPNEPTAPTPPPTPLPSPNEAKPAKTDSQLFEEYRQRILQQALDKQSRP